MFWLRQIFCELFDHLEHLTYNCVMFFGFFKIINVDNVNFGDNKIVDRGLGINIFYDDNVLVFFDDGTRDFFCNDFTKQAVGHALYLPTGGFNPYDTKNLILWCRRSDSNRHGVATAGF